MDWQISTLQWLQQFQHPIGNAFFQWVTMTGEETFYIVVAAWMLWCQNKHMAHRIGIMFLSSAVLNPSLKSLFAVERPIGLEGIDSLRTHTATGYSFPSGHTQGATSFWFAFALQVRKRWVSALALMMIVLVALSRLYLGVHWPLDVLAGIGFGLAWITFAHWFMGYAERTNRQLLWLLLLPFTVAYWIYPENKDLTIAFGAALGFLAGVQLDHAKLNYQPSGLFWQKIIKFVVGIGVIVLLKIALKLILPLPPHIADLLRYAAIGFWLSFGAPWVFSKVRWLNK